MKVTRGEGQMFQTAAMGLFNNLSPAIKHPCLLKFYILATSKVISGWVPTIDSADLLQLYSAAKLGDQAASTMTHFPLQSHYPSTELTSRCPILVMLSGRLSSDK